MGGLQELEPAVLHVRDVAADQFDLQPITVMCAAEQDGLVHEPHAEFAILEDLRDDVFRLGIAVLDRNVARLPARASAGEEVLSILPLALGDEAVGGIENRLGRTVILLQRYDLRARHVVIGEAEYVFNLGRAKRVD